MGNPRRTLSAADVIEHLRLEPLAGEGGYFRQTWSTPGVASSPDPLGTAILYLVTPESWSALHRLTYDEVFHFYLGDPCEMVMASDAGELVEVRLGPDIGGEDRVQHVVPAGWWQGTQLARGGAWALLGTTMAPGFRQDAFELANPELLGRFTSDVRKRLEPYLP